LFGLCASFCALEPARAPSVELLALALAATAALALALATAAAVALAATAALAAALAAALVNAAGDAARPPHDRVTTPHSTPSQAG